MALPEMEEAARHEDCSPELHRSVTMRLFELGGLDRELAEALYRLDLDAASHPLYPDTPQTLAAIRALGVKIALVSNIHYDLRADVTKYRLAQLIDAYVLSFERGFQKPDPRMFELALDALGAEPSDALMVGATGRPTTAGQLRLALPH